MKFDIAIQADTRDVKFLVWVLFVQDQTLPQRNTLLSSAEMTAWLKLMKPVCEGGLGRGSLSSFCSYQ